MLPRFNSPALLAITFLVALLALAMYGCGDVTDSPTSAGQAVEGDSSGRVIIAFSPEAAMRAAKRLDDDDDNSRTDSDLFTPDDDGELEVEIEEDDAEVNVEFCVQEGGVDKDVVITMTVSGSTLDDLGIAFEASGFPKGGFRFVIPAVLKIDMESEDDNPESSDIQAFHIYPDGTSTVAEIIDIDADDDELAVEISIPGFSRYGLRRGSRR